ncbi:phenylacetic acid degradation protein [Deinococcus deserti]|uniref:Putative phenylacetic acid degradation protein n=1 Tax=Deinococcus deserti (strain DSM 17065 / CIP 109153 / LMG 22923 / VCD115) TaxID=546414 RepID=C1D035_DEIDV|nr:phenylacetic acid degradation protein [Deinococcus deserti]ACO45287.1 putative phenylacetic acid degradation protein [Deinococcus deserti VCD115]
MTGSGPTSPAASDTQWPRWEVFKQDAPGRPYQAVGSVHAGDPDHALLTARNVFVRRPAAISLWTVRETDLLTATPEELGAQPDLLTTPGETGTYHVGIKRTNKRSMTFVDLVGTVEASGPGDALRQAQLMHPDALTWLVFPDAAAARTDDDPGTIESWFAPAKEKTYKQQQYYGVIGRHVGELKREGLMPGRATEEAKS